MILDVVVGLPLARSFLSIVYSPSMLHDDVLLNMFRRYGKGRSREIQKN